MPLNWLNTPLDTDISEILAKKKRARAIEGLKAQINRRGAPPAQVRLQLADLLSQAGRTAEAVPVLVGLADEFAGDGFVAKAVAILKRVERIEPGRADVASRLALLVQQQKHTSPATLTTTTTVWRPARPVPEFGMEELSDASMEALAAAAAPEPVLEASAVEAPVAEAPVEEAPVEDAPVGDAPEAEAPIPVVAGDAPTEEASAEPGVDVALAPEAPQEPPVLEAEPTPLEEPAVPAAAAPAEALEPAAMEGVPEEAAAPVDALPEVEPLSEEPRPRPPSAPITKRIRGVFRRFLASLPGHGVHETPSAPAVEEPSAPVEATPVEPGDTVPADAAPPSEYPPLSTAEFQDQLLDIVEDILHRPIPTRVDGHLLDRSRLVGYAQQLLAMPLFGDLTEEELLAVVRGLRLHVLEPGDIAITEDEPGQSLFLMPTGAVKVFVKNPAGRNIEVAALREGQFFGEISSLSGRPRTASVVASTACELLELDKATLDGIARSHPRVCTVLESHYIERASSPEAAAVRAVPLPDPLTRARAIEVLEAHFGESRWDPRMRLRLADLLLKSGKAQDAVDILVGLADELAREGYPEKAVAILKKIEQVQRRNVEVVNLAPLIRVRQLPEAPPPAAAAPAAPAPAPGVRRRAPARTDDRFHGWLVDVVRDTVGRGRHGPDAAAAPPAVMRAYGPGLVASPLFQDFSDDELLAFIQGLRLLSFAPGDVIVTEGEPGQSLFILTTGAVKVFVRDGTGHSVGLCLLGEGSFFGEISTLSGRPRSATVTAAAHCELLEMDRSTLDAIAARHPRVREVLEEFSIARATDPRAESIRGNGLRLS